jgi:hypothetical protein
MSSAGSKTYEGAPNLAIVGSRLRRNAPPPVYGPRFQQADIEDCQAAANSAMIAQSHFREP